MLVQKMTRPSRAREATVEAALYIGCLFDDLKDHMCPETKYFTNDKIKYHTYVE